MISQKAFASTGDLTEKKVSFTEVGPDLFAYTAEGDPNTGVIVGDDCCAVFDAQATPAMARQVIEKVRTVTDKPIKIRHPNCRACGFSTCSAALVPYDAMAVVPLAVPACAFLFNSSRLPIRGQW